MLTDRARELLLQCVAEAAAEAEAKEPALPVGENWGTWISDGTTWHKVSGAPATPPVIDDNFDRADGQSVGAKWYSQVVDMHQRDREHQEYLALYEKERCPCGGSPMWVPFEQQRHLADCTELEDFMRSIGASR